MLLKEVHRRVKNNLQLISSLLNLQSAQFTDPSINDALRESQNRVRSMALIHEKLYQSLDLAQVDFAAYLRSLVTFLAPSYRQQTDRVSLDIQATDLHLDLETAIPCGLIVNELVLNALKHAFPDGRRGSLQVGFQQTETGRVCLKVIDDGVGFDKDFEEAAHTSPGLSLVHSLAEQLGGTIHVQSAQASPTRSGSGQPPPTAPVNLRDRTAPFRSTVGEELKHPSGPGEAPVG